MTRLRLAVLAAPAVDVVLAAPAVDAAVAIALAVLAGWAVDAVLAGPAMDAVLAAPWLPPRSPSRLRRMRSIPCSPSRATRSATAVSVSGRWRLHRSGFCGYPG